MENGEPENILAVFIEEAREIVLQLGEQLDELHYGYDGQRILDDIHRGFHTLKGGAAVIGGLEPLVECSSLCEQILDSLRTKRLALNPGLVSLITRALNAVEAMLDEAGRGDPIRPLPEELRERLAKASGREPEEAAGDGSFSDMETALNRRGRSASSDPLDLFFGDTGKASGGAASSASQNDSGITDDEFESLLDELHGEGRGPTPLAGGRGEPPARDSDTHAAASDDPSTEADRERRRMEQIRSLVTELSWVRSRLTRLSALRSREDLGKALSYLDLVTRDLERWVRELDD